MALVVDRLGFGDGDELMPAAFVGVPISIEQVPFIGRDGGFVVEGQ